MTLAPMHEWQRFEFRQRLGEGGMGVVYRVFDRELGCDVALKTLPSTNAEAIYRLKREFRSLSELSHPNLINLHELICENDNWFFTMELIEGVHFLPYVAGASLAPEDVTTQHPSDQDSSDSARLSFDKTFTRSVSDSLSSEPSGEPVEFIEPRLNDALTQLTLGLQALHDAGKEHRDLKPANVMVTQQGRVVLLDFGLAVDHRHHEFYEDFSRLTSASGTPAYMAPERHRGEGANDASDWFSVGVMLYEALTGQKPFLRQADLLAGVMPPIPHLQNPRIPKHLSELAIDLLAHDPKRRPNGPQVLERLGRRERSSRLPLATTTTRNELVGREHHLAELTASLDELSRGHCVQVHLKGKSGFGKTALAQHFLSSLVDRNDTVVLAGRCYERESVPYKVFDSIIDALARYLQTLPDAQIKEILPPNTKALARLFPALLRLPQVGELADSGEDFKDLQELSRQASAALKSLFSEIARKQQLLLYVDDLQWGDIDSARVLADLLAPPAPAMMLMLSFRAEDVGHSAVLTQLLEATTQSVIPTKTLEVGPISPQEATELAKRILGEGFSVEAENLTREASGSPFFVQQLAHFAGRARLRREVARLTLKEVLLNNLGQLGNPARRLLTAICVAGRPLRRSWIFGLAEPTDDAATAFAELRNGRWVRTSGPRSTDTVEVFHDKIREVLVHELSVDALVITHRRLAEMLETQAPNDSEALATHWLSAQQPSRASRHALEAAKNAARSLAFERAAEWYRAALDTLPPSSARREAQLGLAASLRNAGRGPEAANAYLLAAADAKDADERLDLERRGFEQLLISGELERGRQVAKNVLSVVGLSMPQTRTGTLASLLYRRMLVSLRGLEFRSRKPSELSRSALSRMDACWSVAVGMSLVDNKLGADFTARFLLYSLQAGDPERISLALSLEAAHQGGAAHFRKAEKLIAQAEALAQYCRSPHAIALAEQNHGWIDYFQGKYAIALDRFLNSSIRLREQCEGVTWEISTADLMATWSLIYLGEWKRLKERHGLLMSEARQTGNLYRIDILGICGGVISGLMDDDVSRVRKEMAEAAEVWTPSGFQLQQFFRLLMRGWVDLYAGDATSYWPHLESQWKPLRNSLLLTVVEINYRMQHIRAYAALAQPDSPQFRAEALRCAQRLAKIPSAGASAFASVVKAAIAKREHREEVAIKLLDEAQAEFNAAGMSLFAAAALWRSAEIVGGTNGRTIATAAYEKMKAQGIVDPQRALRLFTPGF